MYGTAEYGGAAGYGTVFSLPTDGSAFASLYSFTATNALTGTNKDGAVPVAGLAMTGGVLYGTASAGGTAGYGTVFSLLIPPPVSIGFAGPNVVVTWPAGSTGFALQTTTNLAAPAWTTVSGQNAVTNPISGPQRYYRLLHP